MKIPWIILTSGGIAVTISLGPAALAQVDWLSEDYEYLQSAEDGIGYERLAVNGVYRVYAPIHIASARGDTEVVNRELAEGIPVDLQVVSPGAPYDGATPLMLAAAFGQRDIISLLLERGADISAATSQGITALMCAAGAISEASGPFSDCVSLLLKNGAIPDTRDQVGRTALIYACGGGMAMNAMFNPEIIAPFRPNTMVRRVQPQTGDMVTNRRGVQPPLGGSPDRVHELLVAGASTRIRDASNASALHYAAVHPNVAISKELLSLDAYVDQQAIIFAAAYGTGEVFDHLLEMVEDVHWLDRLRLVQMVVRAEIDSGMKLSCLLHRGMTINIADDGERLLADALDSRSDGSAVPVLLNLGVSPLINLPNGDTPLMAAAAFANHEVLRALLAFPFDVNASSVARRAETALMLAAASERASDSKVRLLLAHGADPNARTKDGLTAILYAARAGNMSAVVALAESGADPNVSVPRAAGTGWIGGMTPLLYVANSGGDPIVLATERGDEALQALLSLGANPNDSLGANRSALVLGLESGQAGVVDCLLKAGARVGNHDINISDEEMILESVISKGNADTLEVVLRNGIDPNRTIRLEEEDLTALGFACARGQAKMAEILLSAGASANGATSSGVTALMAAVVPFDGATARGVTDVVKRLLEREANVNATDVLGRTAVMRLCEHISGNSQTTTTLLQMLIQAEADLHLRDEAGQSAMHYAARGAYRETIDILLASGAQLQVLDRRDRSPLDIARERWGDAAIDQVPSFRYLVDLIRDSTQF